MPFVRRLYTTPRSRIFALSGALRGWWFPRFVGACVAGAAAAVAVAALVADTAAAFLVAAAVFFPVTLACEVLLMRGQLRAAYEAFAWIGRWEWLRAGRELGQPFPATPWGALTLRRRVADPEPHPAWVELLVVTGELGAARALAERLPERSRWQRFERALTLSWVDWIESGRLDDAAARQAAAQLADPEEQLRAAALLSLNDARERLTRGEDWLEPLVAARRRLGSRADGILRHEWWRTQARGTAAVAVGIAAVYALAAVL